MFFFHHFKQNLLYVLLALMLSVWLTELKTSAPVQFKIGLTLSTDARDQPIQFYCHDYKVYTGKTLVDNKYSSATEKAPGIYHIVNDIACGPTATHLRFDPLPSAGEVSILDMRVHTRYWHHVPLAEAMRHIKPINSIESIVLEDQKIVITANGDDPYLELSNNLQSYVATETRDYLIFLVKYFMWSLLALMLVLFLLSTLLGHGPQIKAVATRVKNQFDRGSDRFFAAVHRHHLEPVTISGLLILVALLIYLFAAFVFSSHLVPEYSAPFVLIFLFIALQFIILLAIYVIFVSWLRWSRALTVLAGSCFVFINFLLAADASLFSLNGMHISQGWGILTDGGISQFFNNLRFTGLSKAELSVYVAIIFASVALSIGAVWAMEFKLTRFQLRLNKYQVLAAGILSVLLVYGTQQLATPLLNVNQVSTYQNNHPIGISFFDVKEELVSFPAAAKPYQRQDQLQMNDTQTVRPDITNIYLFIFESLREDVVNHQVTPRLQAFREQSWHFSKGVASGNATHYGWYAIINARQPFYWERYKRLNDKQGSVPLQLFRQLGFNINIYSAKDLSYLQSDKIMFGEDMSLFDFLSPHPPMTPPEHDRRVMNTLLKDIDTKHPNSKNLNVVFLDSSHYPYRWNPNEIEAIEPFQGTAAEGTDLSHAMRIIKTDKDLIFNRYKNSIKYMDFLFGQMLDAIRTSNLSQKSMVIAVGDHGQQFMEHGYMLHGFTLYDEDIVVPIYFQASDIEPRMDNRVVSHVDILPTVFDYLGVNTDQLLGMDGKSMLNNQHGQYQLTSVAGEQNTPSSFVLTSPDWKVYFKTNKNNPADFTRIGITQVTDKNDQVYLPGNGLEADYKAFMNREFPDFLNRIPILKNP